MLPLELRAMPILFRLAPIAASSLLLVARHACPQRNVHSWWCGEAKALRYLHEIQLIDIEDASQAVGRVGLEVRTIAVLC